MTKIQVDLAELLVWYSNLLLFTFCTLYLALVWGWPSFEDDLADVLAKLCHVFLAK